jgi:hypothetical protein
LELALYCLHHQLLKKYMQEPEDATQLSGDPGQAIRAKE